MQLFKFYNTFLMIFCALTIVIGSASVYAQSLNPMSDGEEREGLLSRALTAELILQEHPDYNNRKIKMGEAEYQDYGDKLNGLPNSKLKIELKRQDVQVDGPFYVYLNEDKIGKMDTVEIEKLGVKYSFHKYYLDTENGDEVPLILEDDTIQLVNGNYVFIIGQFFNTDDFIK